MRTAPVSVVVTGLVLAFGALAQPVVSGLANNYSFLPPGLPNSGIAPGSIFAIFGDQFAKAIVSADPASLSTTLGGVLSNGGLSKGGVGVLVLTNPGSTAAASSGVGGGLLVVNGTFPAPVAVGTGGVSRGGALAARRTARPGRAAASLALFGFIARRGQAPHGVADRSAQSELLGRFVAS